MATIEIRIQSNADAYWIKIDKQDVHMSGPTGDAAGMVVVPTGPHTMFWGLFGDPGEHCAIDILQDGESLLPGPTLGKILPGFRNDGGYTNFEAR